MRERMMFFVQMSLLAAVAMFFSTFVAPLVNFFLSGGLYLLGSDQTITDNRFLGLNRNRCTSDRTKPRCDYSAGDPALLQSGIYLVAGAARPARTAHNRITGNEVAGFGMRKNCIKAAPGVSLAANTITGNRCLDAGDLGH